MRYIMRKICLFPVMIAVIVFTGCGQKKNEDPVTVTLWHVYGGQTESPLNDLIDEFNETIGKEENIRVQVGSVTNTNTIHENVLASAFGDPGASKLPDMFVSYPKTVLAMPDDTELVDYYDYFTEEELNEFIPAFLEEGVIHERLSILPVAKSTEVMFINKTAFDRFAKETGAKMEDLKTWEGLFAMAEQYAAWTDNQTPNIPDDGKNFFVHDYHFNYFQVGVESLGENFFKGENLAFGPEFQTVWEPYAKAALSGGVWLRSGYATEPLRTGDSIVSVASSASVLYYSDEVTYADNTSEKVEIVSMPCLGYMPVKQEAFDVYLPEAIEKLSDPMYVSLYQAFLKTQENYTFYTAPKLDSYLDLETKFEELIRQTLSVKRLEWQEHPEDMDKLVSETLEDFKAAYTQ